MTPRERERVEDEIVLSKCVVNDGVAVAVYSLLIHDDLYVICMSTRCIWKHLHLLLPIYSLSLLYPIWKS